MISGYPVSQLAGYPVSSKTVIRFIPSYFFMATNFSYWFHFALWCWHIYDDCSCLSDNVWRNNRASLESWTCWYLSCSARGVPSSSILRLRWGWAACCVLSKARLAFASCRARTSRGSYGAPWSLLSSCSFFTFCLAAHVLGGLHTIWISWSRFFLPNWSLYKLTII